MAWWRSDRPSPRKREKARALLAEARPEEALALLAGSAYGAGYDSDYFELLGLALLGCGQHENAGRFLFLSGRRLPEYRAPIERFLSRHHDPNNFRQLHSQLPMRVRTMWKLDRFPEAVRDELKALGFPDDIQRYFQRRKSGD
ncbi:hypothetical protein [Paludisphaera sp.]|uniref:hypothetical protein n=1 Tax=Paludisphaera sp. TaxID=2017432 RepID=UPI00301C48C9